MKKWIILFLTAALVFALASPVYAVDTDHISPDVDGGTVAICFLIAFVIALITVLVMKGQLKSVRRQHFAGNYLQEGSLDVTFSQDLYLYRNVTRTPRPKDKK